MFKKRALAWVCGLYGLLAHLLGCGDTPLSVAVDEPQQNISPITYGSGVLGLGVNFAETQNFAQCVTDYKTTKRTEGFSKRLFDEYLIQSRQDLDKSIDINSALRAKIFLASSEHELSYFKNVVIGEDALFWLVRAHYDLHMEMIDTSPSANFGLSPWAKNILKTEGIKSFYKSCGTHFYIARKLGARYDVLYEFSYGGRATKRNVAAHIGTQVNIELDSVGSFGINANSNFKDFLHEAKANSRMIVHSYILGGGYEIKDYADPLSNPEDLSNLANILSALRQSLEVDGKGVPVDWTIQSYDMFPEVEKAKKYARFHDMEDSIRNDALDFYYNRHIENQTSIKKLRELLKESLGDEPYYVYSPEGLAEIEKMIGDLEAQNQKIHQQAKTCVNNSGECLTTGFEAISTKTPDPVEDYSDLGAWSIVPIVRLDQTINFYAERLGRYRPRIFRVSDVLELKNGQAVAQFFDQKGNLMNIVLGTYEHKSDNGRERIELCIGQYKDVCDFRMIENTKKTMPDDGMPTPKLNLKIYDKYGFLIKNYFFMTDAPACH